MKRAFFSAAICAVSLVSCASSQPDSLEGQLTRAAVAARQQGRTTAVIRPVQEQTGQDMDLQRVLSTHSLLLASATGQSIVEPKRHEVITWHKFRNIQPLSRKRSRDACNLQPPRQIRPNSTEIIVPLFTGSAVVYGVTVSYEGLDSRIHLQPGQEYLLVADECPTGVAYLPYGPFSVFTVHKDQVIEPIIEESRPFAAELASFVRSRKLGKKFNVETPE